MVRPADLAWALGVPGDLDVRETHGAWVVLAGDRAYKVKKPVALPFLDYSTLQRRLAACRDEVAVNEALAPGLYIGVRALLEDERGIVLGPLGEHPEAVEYAVEMRRFDESRTLAARLRAGMLSAAQVDELARRLAAFHRTAPVCGGPAAGAFRRRVDSDLAEVAALADHHVAPRLDSWRRFAASAARRCAPELEARAARGLRRDGHGDLRAEHVVLDDPMAIFDRIEFDAELRRTDVGADVAFLVMDLERLGARWAAERLVAGYRAAGGDPGGPRLRAIFAWQRALVRLKVGLLAGDDGAVAAFARRLEVLAWRARAPSVLLVSGPPASGKSTLAGRLGRLLGLPVVQSDVLRKAIAGLPPQERAPVTAYRAPATEATYTALGGRAAWELARRPGVIIDATARSRALRATLLRATAAAEPKVVVVCQAARDELHRRALARERMSRRISDAGVDVALALADSFEPPYELDPQIVCRVRTDVPDPGAVERVGHWLDEHLPPLGAGY
jgi:aminoglycoside phosphotransferase family enzyme/predicted kinase